MMLSKKDKIRTIISLLVGLILCLPLTGFIYGVFACKDCTRGLLSQTIGRVFIGFVEAVLTTLTLGKPWADEAGHPGNNLRPYVIAVWLLIALVTYFMRRKKV
jgi:hypothetical protein